MTNDDIEKGFRTPPLSLRGAPFWSWNDRLQVPELTRQVEDMQAHGMGGFFMHSREGLETPYLGDEWMECIRETVKKAKETGMGAWLYDEDRWPSGSAGGRVPAQGGDTFRAKLLSLEESVELPPDAEQALALFAAVIGEGALLSARRLDTPPGPLNPGETYLVFRREISQPSEWFNDDAYADNLNPDSVKAFIDITYEAYKREVGAEFGKTVPGIFTDEPNILSHHLPSGRRSLPWTDGLLEFFQARRGWDLRGALPWLFFAAASQGEHSKEEQSLACRARHDFWWTISERFTEAYSSQLGEWCEKNGSGLHRAFPLREGDGLCHPHRRGGHAPLPLAARAGDRHADRAKPRVPDHQAVHQRGQPVQPAAGTLRDLRLLGLGIHLRGAEVDWRLAVRAGCQPALPAPGAVFAARLPQARLPAVF